MEMKAQVRPSESRQARYRVESRTGGDMKILSFKVGKTTRVYSTRHYEERVVH